MTYFSTTKAFMALPACCRREVSGNGRFCNLGSSTLGQLQAHIDYGPSPDLPLEDLGGDTWNVGQSNYLYGPGELV